MKYLHHRNIIHGRLKSRNCVVDGRFVLKVTDYGFNEIWIVQNIDTDEKPEGECMRMHIHVIIIIVSFVCMYHFLLTVHLIKKKKDLLWTAPELLRSSRERRRRRGTFAGDVYSFSIVCQEVISRSAPFCMLDMPPKGK